MHFILMCLAVFFEEKSYGKAAGDFAPTMDIGVMFYTGTTGKSMTGALGQIFTFRAESRKGFFRPQAALEVTTTVGKASIGSDTPSASLYGSAFLLGTHFFVFSNAKFTPFVGGSGIAAWNYLKMSSPPTGVEPQTQSLTFGYEVTSGVDIRMGSLDGTALRIKSGFYTTSGKLAGVSGFMLYGFRFSLGLVW